MTRARPAGASGAPGGLAAAAALFFAWGFISPTVGVLGPVVRSIFSLDYGRSMLAVSAFFLAYLLVSLPAAGLLARIGSVRAAFVGLGTVMGGCLLAPVTVHSGSYPALLGAIFLVAAGVTVLQVCAGPMVVALGPPELAASRLTAAQAINGVGQVLAAVAAAVLLLPGVGRAVASGVHRHVLMLQLDRQFLIMAALAALIAGLVWRARRGLSELATDSAGASPLSAFRSGWALFGGAAVFVYVGAEVAIGGILVSFLQQADILGATGRTAGLLVGLYWGGAMVGRFIGAAVLARRRAAPVLAVSALVAAGLCLAVGLFANGLAGVGLGWLAGGGALAVGLFNAVQFPTVFSLTLARSRAAPAAVSGLLCMAITGGAVAPPLMGLIADHAGLGPSFLLPAVCYGVVAAFALAPATARG